MSHIVDKRREENHAWEEYGSVKNLFSIFFEFIQTLLALKVSNLWP